MSFGAFLQLAEGEGFEPSIGPGPMPPFQGGTFNHSATLPGWVPLRLLSPSRIKVYVFRTTSVTG